jgi:predicted DNA-binding transcriptional regulator AlpA
MIKASKAAPAKKKPPAWLNANRKERHRAARKAERKPKRAPQGVPRLLNRHEICAIAGCSFQIIWRRMRAGTFPRSRIVGGRSMWLSTEVEAWLHALPLRPLKGDTIEDKRARA